MNVDLELNSPAMDEESTQAAEPVLDATEPAPSADETQSIYAWSQDGDETLVMQRHSWKFPVALASLAAVAAVATGLIMLWPANKPAPPAQTSTVAVPPPSAIPAPPAVPITPDGRFIAKVKEQGLVLNASDGQLVGAGHQVCSNLASGSDFTHVVHDIIRGSSNVTTDTATYFTETAIDIYCPQYAN